MPPSKKPPTLDLKIIEKEIEYVRDELWIIFESLRRKIINEFKSDYEVQLFERLSIEKQTSLVNMFERITNALAQIHGLRTYSCEKCLNFATQKCNGTDDECPVGLHWEETEE